MSPVRWEAVLRATPDCGTRRSVTCSRRPSLIARTLKSRYALRSSIKRLAWKRKRDITSWRRWCWTRATRLRLESWECLTEQCRDGPAPVGEPRPRALWSRFDRWLRADGLRLRADCLVPGCSETRPCCLDQL